MNPHKQELGILWKLAWPVVLTQWTNMLMGTVDLAMVGRVSAEAMGAVTIGNTWKITSLIVAQGVLFGLDPLISQAHGARDARGMGLALQRGLVLAVLLTLPVTVVWSYAEPALAALGQQPAIAALAGEYVWVQLPSVAPMLVYTALRQYLTGRGILRPALYVTIGANLLNVVLNWVLIFGHLGLPAMGSTGSGIATCIVQVLMAVGLFAWIHRARLWRGAWRGFDRAALELRGLWLVLSKGAPVGLQVGLELWFFNFASLLAGHLGEHELAVHGVVMTLASNTFMVPLGIAIAACTRVGRLLGSGRPDRAQQAAWMALLMGAGVMLVSALVFVVGRRWVPGLLTTDPAVVAAAAAIVPIAAAFQLFDGLQVVGCGVLRGMGRTVPAALFNFIGYYVIATPVILWLTHERGAGLAGIWWGMAIGLGGVAVPLVLWIRSRGPARDPRARLYAA